MDINFRNELDDSMPPRGVMQPTAPDGSRIHLKQLRIIIRDRLIVQSDFDESLREPDGKAWVSYKSNGNPATHGELQTTGLSGEGIPYVTGTDGFSVDHISPKSIDIAYTIRGKDVFRRKFVAPITCHTNIHTKGKSIHCLDVAPGGLGVSSDSEGKLKIWEKDSGEVRRVLEGHLGDVYTCRMFPSGIVALSGGADMQLKIWSAETGQCAATLRGHKASILDTCIIEKGRNFISCSKDGTAKLWDCGTQTCLSTYECESGIVNVCHLQQMSQEYLLGTPDGTIGDREVGTDGKMLLLGCEERKICVYGLRSKKKLWESTDHIYDAVTSCQFISPHLYICGQQDGHMTMFDARKANMCLYAWKESRGPVLSLLKYDNGYLAATGDGSCHYCDHPDGTQLELTGPDCDPVYSVAHDGKYIYTACRDSIIRKYDPTGHIPKPSAYYADNIS